MDYAGRRVTLGGRAVALTDVEYPLLCELAVNAGKTLSTERTYLNGWRRM